MALRSKWAYTVDYRLPLLLVCCSNVHIFDIKYFIFFKTCYIYYKLLMVIYLARILTNISRNCVLGYNYVTRVCRRN